MATTPEEARFNKVFAFIVVFCGGVLCLICTIVFANIPHENQQSANMALGFCMSSFGALSAYLVGASPKEKKEVTQTGDNNKIEVAASNAEIPKP